MLTKKRLLTMSESALRKEVLIPLFRAMGFRNVVEYHGPVEHGKDIVMWEEEPSGARKNYAAVVKAKPISGQAEGKGSAGAVVFQVQQCFGTPYFDSVSPEEQEVHHVYVVCPHEIQPHGLAALKAGLKGANLDRSVTYLTGERLWQLVEVRLSERALLAKLDEWRKALPDVADHSLRVSITRDKLVLNVELKSGAISPHITGKLTFPEDAAGQAARAALQKHIDTGERAVIDGEYIKELALPEILQRMGLEKPDRLELAERELPHSVPLTIEIASHAGMERIGNVVFRGRGGREEIELRSVEDGAPWHVTLRLLRAQQTFQFEINFTMEGRNVKQQLEAFRIREAIAAGGTLRVEDARTGRLIAKTLIDPHSIGEPNQPMLKLLEDVYKIQQATGYLLAIPAEDIPPAQLDAIDHAVQAVQGQTINRVIESIQLSLGRSGAEAVLTSFTEGRTQALFIASNVEVNIFGVKVPLGPGIRHIVGLTLNVENEAALRRALSENEEGPFEVKLTASAAGAQESVRFVDWLPSDEAGQLRAQFQLPE